jgi:hypothetical protein
MNSRRLGFAAALPAVQLPDIRHAMFAALRLD